jgi:hypothetical protein
MKSTFMGKRSEKSWETVNVLSLMSFTRHGRQSKRPPM